ncbi:DUF4232 domain-containing protein [Actinomadura macrotermitis]|uniref:DUF4232 domain-containing protein n=1 Tax=Actinomadura macrotermitis TaxID=2585200 RepID=UPI00188691B9|nr:DUF4232 domain-containing protein [Actinomadura macrotermitis]
MLPAVSVAAVLGLSACDGGTSGGNATAGSSASTPAGPVDSPPAAPPSQSAGGGTPATSRAPQAGGTERCASVHLRPSLANGDAAAGNLYFTLRLTNTGSTACTLFGYPGVSLIRRDGSTIGRPATHEGAQGQTVRLAPGGSATAVLHTANKGVSDKPCWPVPDLLKIYPPGRTEPLTLRTDRPEVCGDVFTVTAMAKA